jgi:Mg-chelatase subunit ChlD
MNKGGQEYAGRVFKTRSGRTCQRWDRQSPHKHTRNNPSKFPDASLADAGNFCRNPDNDPEGPWCYTTDKYTRWEYCDVPVCPGGEKEKKVCKQDRRGDGFRGALAFTASGRACQRWDQQTPHKHTRTNAAKFPDVSLADAANYCRNPDGEPTGPWCYTTDSKKRWETCDISLCEEDIPECYSQESHIDYPGNDIASVAVISADDCLLACDRTPGCKGVAFVASWVGQRSNCWTKKALPSSQRRQTHHVTSFMKKSDKKCQRSTDCYTRYPSISRTMNFASSGAELVSSKVSSTDKCADLCETNKLCVGFYYYQNGAGLSRNCYLMKKMDYRWLKPTSNSPRDMYIKNGKCNNVCVHEKEAPTSCEEIKAKDRSATNGEYCVRLGEDTVQVYCDMNVPFGPYTYLASEFVEKLSPDVMRKMRLVMNSAAIRFLDFQGREKGGVFRQLDEYKALPMKVTFNNQPGFQAPINAGEQYIGAPYIYLGFIPVEGTVQSRVGKNYGLKVNNFPVSVKNCDGNANAYFAFFPGLCAKHPSTYKARVGWYNDGPVCHQMNRRLQNCDDVMPEKYYMCGETHWGGCGCFGSTNGKDMKGMALGFKLAESERKHPCEGKSWVAKVADPDDCRRYISCKPPYKSMALPSGSYFNGKTLRIEQGPHCTAANERCFKTQARYNAVRGAVRSPEAPGDGRNTFNFGWVHDAAECGRLCRAEANCDSWTYFTAQYRSRDWRERCYGRSAEPATAAGSFLARVQGRRESAVISGTVTPDCPSKCTQTKPDRWCTGSGDPHFRTYDGYMIHFQGTCQYTLVGYEESFQHPDIPSFSVEVKNVNRRGNTRVAFVDYVEVEVYNHTFKFGRNRQVWVDGQAVELPWTGHSAVCVHRSPTNRPVLSTDFGLVVEYDGWHYVRAGLPDIFQDQVFGLCGDFDGNARNDMRTKDGVAVGLRDYAAVGNSYQVHGKGGDACEKATDNEDVCPEAKRQRFQTKAMCGLMKDINGPFKSCLQSGVNFNDEFESCWFDACQDEERAAKVICNWLEVAEKKCDDAFEPVNMWRTPKFCPIDDLCGANMEFAENVCNTPNTCAEPQAAERCMDFAPRGCVCKKGMVLSGYDCVPQSECGCAVDGKYMKKGQVWGDEKCGQRFTCTGNNKVHVEALKCSDPNAECVNKPGLSKACYCKDGYTFNSFKRCISIKPPTVCPTPEPPTYVPPKPNCDENFFYNPLSRTCEKFPDLGVDGCGVKVDIVFVVDSSGSVGRQNFDKVRAFLAGIVRRFDVGPDKTRFGVVRFSRSSDTIFGLNTYSASAEVVAGINNMAYVSGSTNTAKALTMAQKLIQKERRPKVDTYVVVVTDGKSNKEKDTLNAAKQLLAEKVKVFAVGVGRRLNQKELKAIAGDDKRVVLRSSFAALAAGFSDIAAQTCEDACSGGKCITCAPGFFKQDNQCFEDKCAKNPCKGQDVECVNVRTSFECRCKDARKVYDKCTQQCVRTLARTSEACMPTVPACQKGQYFSRRFGCVDIPNLGQGCAAKIDIVFLLENGYDCQGSLDNVKTFMKGFAQQFKVGGGHTRFGVVVYSQQAEQVLTLRKGDDIKDVLKAVDQISSVESQFSNTSAGLYAVRDLLTEEANQKTPTFVVVMQTSRSDQAVATTEAAEQLKMTIKNLRVFSMGVGLDVNLDELTAMASDHKASYVMVTRGSHTLPYVYGIAAQRVCKDSSSPMECGSDKYLSEGVCYPDYCALKTRCDSNATCENLAGYFRCSCNDGFVMDPNTDTCVQEPTKPQCPNENELFSFTENRCVTRPNLGTGCGVKADIVFVLDASGSVGSDNFKKMKKFASAVVGEFTVGVDHLRVGALSYSSSTELELSLDNSLNAEQVKAKISSIRYTKGGTRTDLALAEAREELLKHQRKDTPNVIVVITDGRSNKKALTLDEAKKTLDAGITVFTVAVGTNFDVSELEAISSDPDDKHILRVQNFGNLENIITKIAVSVCEETCAPGDACYKCQDGFIKNDAGECVQDHCAKKPCKNAGEVCSLTETFYECNCPDGQMLDGDKCVDEVFCGDDEVFMDGACKKQGDLGEGCTSQADVLFVIDGSGSVKKHNFQKVLNTLKKTIRKFQLGADKTHVGILQFSSNTKYEIKLGAISDQRDLEKAIDQIQYMRRGTRTDRALMTALRILSGTDARSDAVPLMVLITDGRSNNPIATKHAASAVKQAKIQVVAVGVGSRVDMNELMMIAPKYHRQAPNWDELVHLNQWLALDSCSETCMDPEDACFSCKMGQVQANGVCYDNICESANPCIGEDVTCEQREGNVRCRCDKPMHAYTEKRGCVPAVWGPGGGGPKRCRDGTICSPNADCKKVGRSYKCVCQKSSVAVKDASGVTSCIPVGWCSGSGDPHYTTFDKYKIHFQGSCTYILAQSTAAATGPKFTVLVTTWRKPNKKPTVSFVKEVRVMFASYDILIQQNKVTKVNGERVSVFLRDDVRVENVGKYMVVTAQALGLKVYFDGHTTAKVAVPTTYTKQVEGICGNWNGIKEDDMVPRGEDKPVKSYARLGDSWVWQHARCAQTEDTDPAETCPAEKRAKVTTDCEFMKRGPFTPAQSVLSSEDYITDCVEDACASSSDDDLCAALATYADDLQRQGTLVRYLAPGDVGERCIPTCGPQQEFRFDAVLRTCMDVHADRPLHHTAGSQGDACVCQEGYVYDGQQCVLPEDCGCFKDGRQRKKGEVWSDDVCGQQFTCVGGNRVRAAPTKCIRPGASCTLRDGRWGCFCGGSADQTCETVVGPPVDVPGDTPDIDDPEVDPLPEDEVVKPIDDTASPATTIPPTTTAAEGWLNMTQTPIPTIPALECKDLIPNCASLKTFCSNRAHPLGKIAANNCHNTCGLCTAADLKTTATPTTKPPTTQPPTTQPPQGDAKECKDLIPNCAAGLINFCSNPSHPAYKLAAIKCPKSCGLCTAADSKMTATPTTKPPTTQPPTSAAPECTNSKPDSFCATFKPHCGRFALNAKLYCKKTCGLCGESEPILKPSSTPAPETCLEDGFSYNPATGKCEDIDECLAPVSPCPTNAQCVNQPGSFYCVCDRGYDEVTDDTGDLIACNKIEITPVPSTKPPKDDEEYEFPDENGEDNDDEYFRLKPDPTPKAKPRELGMATGLIADIQITASTFVIGKEPERSRPFSLAGWMPREDDDTPFITIDLLRPLPVHGFGTLGDYTDVCWVAAYHVYVSDDGENFSPLVDESKTQPDGSHPPRLFLGNRNQNTWKRHCVHRYYGEPITTRYIRFYPVMDSKNFKIGSPIPADVSRGCIGMRIELYGFRAPDDPELIEAMKDDVWTRKPTGCKCYFDQSRSDCACCEPGGCQCSSMYPHQCVQCGYGSNCGIPELPHRLFLRDGWTLSRSNCPCSWDPSRSDCACCNEARFGVQCPLQEHANQCVQPGQEETQCGNKEHVFGPNRLCVPKSCPIEP